MLFLYLFFLKVFKKCTGITFLKILAPFWNLRSYDLFRNTNQKKIIFNIKKLNKSTLITKKVRDNFAKWVVILRIFSHYGFMTEKIDFSLGGHRQFFYNWILARVFYIFFKKCLTEGTYYCSKKKACQFFKDYFFVFSINVFKLLKSAHFYQEKLL